MRILKICAGFLFFTLMLVSVLSSAGTRNTIYRNSGLSGIESVPEFFFKERFAVHPFAYYLVLVNKEFTCLEDQDIKTASLIPANIRLISISDFFLSKQVSNQYIILGVIMVFVLFLRGTINLRKANKILKESETAAKEITRQKDLLSRRNKNIEDSLAYAKKLQKAMLFTHKQFKLVLPDSFIVHKPKDIVSGDFYWISEMDDKVFIAGIDCTGHSVPGAFLSLIGFELFRKIINDQNIHKPAKILDAMNKNLDGIFGNGQENFLKDGMDLAFCVFHKDKDLIEYAGAVNPLYILRDDRLIEIKGDRFSVGAYSCGPGESSKKFTNHEIQLQKNDMIYIFTDGYVDQFGGPEGKKFKYRRFRHLLLNIHKLAPERQRLYLEAAIEEWKGNLEQIDDILIIGIKIV